MAIDLDHNATTPLDPRVGEAMAQALERLGGNPSSIHAEGRLARDAVERARAEVAALLGVLAAEIVFTSGGTEADVLAIVGAARAAPGPRRIVTSRLEHPAVHGAAAALAELAGFAVVHVPADGAGRIDPADVARAVGSGATLCSFARANHELGNVYDVAALARAARAAGAVVHCDAVQAAGKLPLAAQDLDADLVAISAHKIHGPKGIGALWVRRGTPLAPLTAGGHQERGLRGGTENVAGIIGFGVAARICRLEAGATWARMTGLRDRLEAAALAIPGSRRHGDADARVPGTTNLGFDGVPGDLLVAALDLEGVAASTGAACTSGSVEASPVLLGLGLPRERAAEGVRLSLGRATTEAEIDRVAALLPTLVARIRASL
jgi:cysteine desulfurase